MRPKKTIYPIETQQKILRDATETVISRYGNDPTVLAMYLSGTALTNQLGAYEKEYHGRKSSDIDIMLVVNDTNQCPLSSDSQKYYGVRHIGPFDDLPLYRVVDSKQNDVFFNELHPIEMIVLTKEVFDGALSGRHPWGRETQRSFADELRTFEIMKESQEIKELRKKYKC